MVNINRQFLVLTYERLNLLAYNINQGYLANKTTTLTTEIPCFGGPYKLTEMLLAKLNNQYQQNWCKKIGLQIIKLQVLKKY